jgi:hypothetical protein
LFGIFKRGMKGVCQHCSSKHLQCYLHEFDFRYTLPRRERLRRCSPLRRGTERCARQAPHVPAT